jgi:hypothetical protein
LLQECSLAAALCELGIVVGNQRIAELMIHDWARRDFRRLINYCYSAQAFQDVPFSWPFTFQTLDHAFPGSKFILTVRDTPEQWYDSLLRFYAKIFGEGKLPALKDLKNSTYVYKGWAYEANRLITSTPKNDLFNKEILIANYISYNDTVGEYFRHRPEDLLVLNVAKPGAYDRLCDFLGKPRTGKEFPWENRTGCLLHNRI